MEALFLTGKTVLGLAMLILGAEGLVRGSSSLARRLGVSRLMVGLTVVALGTSLPEIAVAIASAGKGANELVWGNVIGSNIANGALVLGAAALLMPLTVDRDILRRDMPMLILATLVTVVAAAFDILSFGAGIVLIATGFLANALIIKDGLKLRAANKANGNNNNNGDEIAVWLVSLYILSGGTLLYFGADIVVEGAVGLGKILGLSEAFIGITVVALGTSLPELVTTIWAGIRNEPDLSVGNVVGSNIMNLAFALGPAAIISKVEIRYPVLDLGMLIAITLVMLIFFLTGKKIVRWEGAVLVAIYFAFITLSYLVNTGVIII